MLRDARWWLGLMLAAAAVAAACPTESQAAETPASCREAALGAFGGVGFGVRAGRRIDWQMEAEPVPAECGELGTWAISAYAAGFSRRHAYPGRPARLGRTVSWMNATDGVTYTQPQTLARRARGDAIVNAVIWTTWIPRGGGRAEHRHSDGFALVVGFADCDARVSTAAFACDPLAGGVGAEPARSLSRGR